MHIILNSLAILLYTACTVLIARRVRRVIGGQDAAETPNRCLRGMWLAALLIHGAGIYLYVDTPLGMNLGFFHAISLVSWLMAALLLATNLKRPLENLGLVLLPVAALALAVETLFPETGFTPSDMAMGLDIHIFVSLLAYSVLSLAALQAGVLAAQNRHLHNHQPGGFLRALPPLQHMESLLFQMIGLGFLLLSLALTTGFIYLEDIFAQHQVHKTVLSLAAWLIFAILLWGRWQFGWRGRIAIRWTLGGFVALLLAYFGSKLVLELLINR